MSVLQFEKPLNLQSAPPRITLAYKEIDGAHTFSTVEVNGLIIIDSDMENAFNDAVEGVGELISELCGCKVTYHSSHGFAAFIESLVTSDCVQPAAKAGTMVMEVSVAA